MRLCAPALDAYFGRAASASVLSEGFLQADARKGTPRVLRNFAQARIQDKYQSQEVGCTKVGDNDFFADAESQAVGDEEPMIFDS